MVDEVNTAASCSGVNVTWSSDRPWAGARPFPSGLAAVGQTLTTSFDVWAGNPAVGRQWKRCDAAGGSCVDIPGATGQNYVPTDDDVGHILRVDESATEMTVPQHWRTRYGHAGLHPGRGPRGSVARRGRPRILRAPGRHGPPSSCPAPKSAPATTGNEIRFYDVFMVRSLINEPACVWVAQIPRVNGGITSGLAIYSPTFDPADLTTNYVADDSSFGTLSATSRPARPRRP